MSIIGTWNLTVATPMGEQSIVLDLIDEAPPTGTATAGAETVALYDVVVDEDHLTATQDVKTPFPMTVKLDLTADGNAISGTAAAGPFPPATVTGARV